MGFEFWGDMLIHGDCLTILKGLKDNSLDSLITDPPAGISFMGKSWDEDKGGRKQWVAWMSEVMRECLRVLKPGAHGLVWAIPRTSHWTATALEDAGFEIRDVVTHLFGSGFPKSMDISKAIDKQAGAEREDLGPNPNRLGRHQDIRGGRFHANNENRVNVESIDRITKPATAGAKQWQGFGTALKPASEHWILVRKPCSEKTVAANVLKHGTGGINIDASRIGTADNLNGGRYSDGKKGDDGTAYGTGINLRSKNDYSQPQGRFPANLLLSHNPDCVGVGVKKVKSSNFTGSEKGRVNEVFGKDSRARPGFTYADADGTETVSAWECTENCAVALLDEQSGVSKSNARLRRGQYSGGTFAGGLKQDSTEHDDSGGASRFFKTLNSDNPIDMNPDNFIVPIESNLDTLPAHSTDSHARGATGHSSNSNTGTNSYSSHNSILSKNGGSHNCVSNGIGQRFFYCAKASKKDKGEGNSHPTVKSSKLMSYLITMITPPNGVVLDPFMGSGSTLVAAQSLGFPFIGIEQEKEYLEIAKGRLKSCHS